jgi:hypothetical protein
MDIPRISIEDLKRRMAAHEALAVLDSRAADAWKSSESQIPGSIRVPPDEVDKLSFAKTGAHSCRSLSRTSRELIVPMIAIAGGPEISTGRAFDRTSAPL